MTRAEKLRGLAAIAEEAGVNEELCWEIHDLATEEEDKEYNSI